MISVVIEQTSFMVSVFMILPRLLHDRIIMLIGPVEDNIKLRIIASNFVLDTSRQIADTPFYNTPVSFSGITCTILLDTNTTPRSDVQTIVMGSMAPMWNN